MIMFESTMSIACPISQEPELTSKWWLRAPWAKPCVSCKYLNQVMIFETNTQHKERGRGTTNEQQNSSFFQRAKTTLHREGKRGSTDIQNLSWSTGLADIVVLQRNALHVYSGADSIPFQTLLRSPSSLPSHDLICKAAISVVVAFALVLLHCLQPAHDLQYRLDTATSSVSSHF